MKKDAIQTILMACGIGVLVIIAVILAMGTGEVTDEDESHTHTHNEYVVKSGDTMTGDLNAPNLYASNMISGDGSGLRNLNASRLSMGTIDTARLPANIDAGTLDGVDSTSFALVTHDHNSIYYTKLDSDNRYAQLSHAHPPGDAATLDGIDSTSFALATHDHGTIYYMKTESDNRYSQLSHAHSPGDADTFDGLDSTDFSLAVHTHDTRYYQQAEVDANFLSLSGGTLTGDLYLPNLYATSVINGDGSGISNLNASRITTGTIAIGRLPLGINADTLDGLDSLGFSMAIHSHDASDITSGALDEARLPQDAIDETEIETGLGLVPSGTIVMWNGTSIPNGWALCDGTNGTPDLRGMFIAGYDSNDPDYNAIGNIGGEKNHTLNTSEMPSHWHSYSSSTSMSGNHVHSYEDRYWDPDQGGPDLDEGSFSTNGMINQPKVTASAGAHSHTISGSTDNTGGGQAHENRPPYYVLSFIMKL